MELPLAEIHFQKAWLWKVGGWGFRVSGLLSIVLVTLSIRIVFQHPSLV